MGTRIPISFAAAALGAAPLASCSSHLIENGLPDGRCAAGNCTASQTSYFGNAGFSSNAASGRVVKDMCGTAPLTRVEVRRDLGQGLISLLTLGTVNPATIEFACAKSDSSASYINCDQIDGTGGNGLPVQIACITKATSGAASPTRFDCTATGSPAEPERLLSFTCAATQDAAAGDARPGIAERGGG